MLQLSPNAIIGETTRSLAGEVGLANAPRPGPGSVRVGLLDALYTMGADDVAKGARVEAVE